MFNVLQLQFHFHNALLWDGEDVMFRVWIFLLLFVQLHRKTIFELMGIHKFDQTDSWPIWPFRLWQLEMCFIYLGASFGKLVNYRWQKGVALYHVRSGFGTVCMSLTPLLISNSFY